MCRRKGTAGFWTVVCKWKSTAYFWYPYWTIYSVLNYCWHGSYLFIEALCLKDYCWAVCIQWRYSCKIFVKLFTQLHPLLGPVSTLLHYSVTKYDWIVVEIKWMILKYLYVSGQLAAALELGRRKISRDKAEENWAQEKWDWEGRRLQGAES